MAKPAVSGHLTFQVGLRKCFLNLTSGFPCYHLHHPHTKDPLPIFLQHYMTSLRHRLENLGWKRLACAYVQEVVPI